MKGNQCNEDGSCKCKSGVIEGGDCDQCNIGYYKFTKREYNSNTGYQSVTSCELCKCSLAGSVNMFSCEKQTGKCTCKQNFGGNI